MALNRIRIDELKRRGSLGCQVRMRGGGGEFKQAASVIARLSTEQKKEEKERTRFPNLGEIAMSYRGL